MVFASSLVLLVGTRSRTVELGLPRIAGDSHHKFFMSVMKTVANRCKSVVSEKDIFSGFGLLARFLTSRKAWQGAFRTASPCVPARLLCIPPPCLPLLTSVNMGTTGDPLTCWLDRPHSCALDFGSQVESRCSLIDDAAPSAKKVPNQAPFIAFNQSPFTTRL